MAFEKLRIALETRASLPKPRVYSNNMPVAAPRLLPSAHE